MGCFDSVYADCPKCGEQIELQSKAGHCHLDSFPAYNVPVIIASDVNGDSVFCECGAEVIFVAHLPEKVSMTVGIVSKEAYPR